MKLKRQIPSGARALVRDPELETVVRDIVSAVARDGDAAVARFTERFDKRAPNSDGGFELTQKDRALRAASASDEVSLALGRAALRIRRFHEKQVTSGYQIDDGELGLRVVPLKRVGLYVPGGTALYPSSVLMNGIPAAVAGVDEVIMVTPAASPAALRAAELAGVDRVFEIGGAQAIAALAVGTKRIPRVDKIVGPGNRYVAEAKRQVFGWVDIDSVAGPSEVLIIADVTANPRWIAADLLAQAEHDSDALPILLCTSEVLIEAVERELSEQLEDLPRAEIARAALESGGAAVVVGSLEEAVEIAEEYAPEHLELLCENARELARTIRNAGAIFVGGYSPEAAGDYMAGPNHVLPTAGAARYASPLGVYDFVKHVSVIDLSRQRLQELSADIQKMAAAEGLSAHARSVAIRFENKNREKRQSTASLASSNPSTSAALGGSLSAAIVAPQKLRPVDSQSIDSLSTSPPKPTTPIIKAAHAARSEESVTMSDQLLSLVPDRIRMLQAYHVPRPSQIRAKMDANEMPYPVPEELQAELADFLSQVDLNRYPSASCAELREAIADRLKISGEHLVFGNGSDQLIQFIIMAFSKPRPGAEQALIFYPTPSFVYYRLAALGVGAEPLEVPLDDDFNLPLARIRRVFDRARPNVAFFARPNNPTGTLWASADLLELARQYPDVLFISDEAYAEYCGDSMVRHVGDVRNLAVMQTFSKVGFAGLRIGYLYGTREVVGEVDKVRPPYNIGSLNQAAALWLLESHPELIAARGEQIIRERERLAMGLRKLSGIRVYPSDANLVLVRVGKAGDGQAGKLWQELAGRGVLVRNLDRPGPLAGCLRITVGTPDENDLLLSELPEALDSIGFS